MGGKDEDGAGKREGAASGQERGGVAGERAGKKKKRSGGTQKRKYHSDYYHERVGKRGEVRSQEEAPVRRWRGQAPGTRCYTRTQSRVPDAQQPETKSKFWWALGQHKRGNTNTQHRTSNMPPEAQRGQGRPPPPAPRLLLARPTKHATERTAWAPRVPLARPTKHATERTARAGAFPLPRPVYLSLGQPNVPSNVQHGQGRPPPRAP